MQETSAIWDIISQATNHSTEFKVVVNEGSDDEFNVGMDSLISLSTTCNLFGDDSFGFGHSVSAQMSMSLYQAEKEIPKSSRISIYVRLVEGDSESEWLSQGTFYVSSRATSYNGVTTISAFDAMMRADQLMYTTSGEQDSWPKIDREVVNYIATVMEVDVNPETEEMFSEDVGHEYPIQFPGYGSGGCTIRQVLEYIGALYAGNWIIDELGKLKLIKHLLDPTEVPTVNFNLGKSVESIENGLIFHGYSGIKINPVDVNENDEGVVYISGDVESEPLEFDNPWGSQIVADNLYEEVASVYPYIPFEAVNAVVDPSFQLGDVVEIDSKIYVITTYTRNFGQLYAADISATSDREEESEYPYIPEEERARTQSNARMEAKLILQQNAIEARVEHVADAYDSENLILNGSDEKILETGSETADYSLKENAASIITNQFATLSFETEGGKFFVYPITDSFVEDVTEYTPTTECSSSDYVHKDNSILYYVYKDLKNYSNANTYSVGDLCIVNDERYVCTVDIFTPEEWNPDHWAQLKSWASGNVFAPGEYTVYGRFEYYNSSDEDISYSATFDPSLWEEVGTYANNQFKEISTSVSLYDEETDYNINDICIYDDKAYIAKQNIESEEFNADHWDILNSGILLRNDFEYDNNEYFPVSILWNFRDLNEAKISGVEFRSDGTEIDHIRNTNLKVNFSATENYSDLLILKNSITSKVSSVESSIENVRTELSSQITQTGSELDIKFTKNISDVSNGLKDHATKQEGYIRASYSGDNITSVEIGESSTEKPRLKLASNRISFYQGENEGTYITQNKLHSLDMEAINSIGLPNKEYNKDNSGYFVWQTKANGHLSLVWNTNKFTQ